MLSKHGDLLFTAAHLLLMLLFHVITRTIKRPKQTFSHINFMRLFRLQSNFRYRKHTQKFIRSIYEYIIRH